MKINKNIFKNLNKKKKTKKKRKKREKRELFGIFGDPVRDLYPLTHLVIVML